MIEFPENSVQNVIITLIPLIRFRLKIRQCLIFPHIQNNLNVFDLYLYCKTLNIRTRTIIWTKCTTFDSVLYLYWNTWFEINIWPILWIFHHFNVPYVYGVYISDLLNWMTGWNFFSCTTLKWFTRVSLAYSLSCNSII